MAFRVSDRLTPCRPLCRTTSLLCQKDLSVIFRRSVRYPCQLTLVLTLVRDTWRGNTPAELSRVRVMTDDRNRDQTDLRTIRIRGRWRTYLETRRIGRCVYYLLEPVGSPFRRRHLAFDPLQGPGGDFFLVQTWARGPTVEQQLRVLRRLKDDSFPRVVDWNAGRTNIDVVLTWAEGVSLAEYLQHIRAGRRPAIEPGQALRLIYGLAAAVCKLHHQQQVAHGDIQPENVIVTSHPSRFVLIDFGSAWTTDSTSFRVEGDGHHRCYAAPELQQPQTQPAGFFADQFSVSVLLYELLTRQLPYGGLGGKAGRVEFAAKSKNGLHPPSQINPACAALPRSLRERLDQAVTRGLAFAPQDRFPDRHAWLRDLSELSARFRLAPELSPVQSALTRVIQWFARSS